MRIPSLESFIRRIFATYIIRFTIEFELAIVKSPLRPIGAANTDLATRDGNLPRSPCLSERGKILRRNAPREIEFYNLALINRPARVLLNNLGHRPKAFEAQLRFGDLFQAEVGHDTSECHLHGGPTKEVMPSGKVMMRAQPTSDSAYSNGRPK